MHGWDLATRTSLGEGVGGERMGKEVAGRRVVFEHSSGSRGREAAWPKYPCSSAKIVRPCLAGRSASHR
eukprot:123117-Alexandrium_andersonii.AAC.1